MKNMDTRLKIIRIATLVGLGLFFVVLFLDVALSLFSAHIIISPAFGRTMLPYGLATGCFSGSSLVIGVIFAQVKLGKRSWPKKIFAHLQKNLGQSLVYALTSTLVVFVTAYGVIDIPAQILHARAPKEHISIDAIATSAWPARRDLRHDCQHHLVFHEPRIGFGVQYVCISWSDWVYFRSADFPMTIRLSGERSDYGYALRYSD